jgi:hypothetical protein
MMSRFIVKNHELIEDKLYWFSGVVLQYQGKQAIVKSDTTEL